jgi:hypothetical protein
MRPIPTLLSKVSNARLEGTVRVIFGSEEALSLQKAKVSFYRLFGAAGQMTDVKRRSVHAHREDA